MTAETRTTAQESKSILAGCSLWWGSPFRVGTHHLLNGFANEGWRVGHLSSPISPLHLVAGISDELRARWSIYRAGGVTYEHDRIWSYVPAALAAPHNRPMLRGGSLLRNWPHLTMPSLQRVLRENSFDDVDVLYLDSANYVGLLDIVAHRKSVFRIVDQASGFAHYTRAWGDVEREIAQRVDLVIYTAGSLEPYVASLNPKKMMHLPNGVDFQHFAGSSAGPPAEYASLARPIAVYVGALEVWFDYALIEELARRMPDMQFVLIGPDALARKRLPELPNIYLLGRRAFEDLPAYLGHADVGLIPFDVDNFGELVNKVNPLKMYEYLAAGLPVVATRWEELVEIGAPALLCIGASEFEKGIREAVADSDARAQRVAYAAEADWRSRVHTLIDALAVGTV